MIKQIVEKIYLKYGVHVPKKHVWMVLILLVSIFIAIIFFSISGPKKTILPDPENSNIQESPNMPPRLKNKQP